jgi:mono/diheme cytochrome c family protein
VSIAARALGVLAALALAAAAHAQDDLAPRVPAAELAAARVLASPLAAGAENLARGRALYTGKGFCSACHGADGRGFGADIDPSRLRGALPRDFTNAAWQRARTDGELYWVIAHGVPGTAMASFVPSVLSSEEAWAVLLYVRSFAR